MLYYYCTSFVESPSAWVQTVEQNIFYNTRFSSHPTSLYRRVSRGKKIHIIEIFYYIQPVRVRGIKSAARKRFELNYIISILLYFFLLAILCIGLVQCTAGNSGAADTFSFQHNNNNIMQRNVLNLVFFFFFTVFVFGDYSSCRTTTTTSATLQRLPHNCAPNVFCTRG